MLIAHKIALNPNNKQKTYFAKAAGTARFAYNWGLHEWKRQYEACKTDPSLKKPTEAALRRQLNAIKKEAFPWMQEVTKNAPQMALIQLGEAFKNFFAKRAGYPQVRRKGIHERFTLSNDQFQVNGTSIRIPRLGWVRMHESLRFEGKIMSATLSREAKHWFASIVVDTPNNINSSKTENQGAVGVDLGVLALATLSTGETVVGPKALKTRLKRIKRLSRSLSRKRKGSRNRKKAQMKLATAHAKIKHIRHHALHQLSTDLVRRFDLIAIEDLNVKGMLRNHRLARAIADMGFYEFRRMLEYKAKQYGKKVVVIDRWFPSTKLCSRCHYLLDKLPLSERTWVCPGCQTAHQRDINAAINIRNLAASSAVSACGEEGSGSDCKILVKPASMKQEVNTNSYL
jgi:putative transposase